MRAKLLCAVVLLLGVLAASAASPNRPNIVIILADDLGYADLGCYGSEIATPNIDRLAAQGVRFAQFYNTARCCPTRASLLTGLYSHQAGVGHMTRDDGKPGYRGFLSERCATIAELLRAQGYATFMSGKWHLGMQRPHWPVDHGFDRSYAFLSGACNYFRPEPHRRMAIDDQPYVPPKENFYMTDAISDHAVEFVARAAAGKKPFFLYVAYTAPHAPLHALPEDIAKYRGKYRVGWDEVRRRRHQRQLELGVLDKHWPLSPCDPGATAWDALSDKEKDLADLKMAVYAAQNDRMDQGIGRILNQLEQAGMTTNTLVIFLSDNGGDAEEIGNSKPGALPGSPDSDVGYGLAWANVSNVPFRGFKRGVFEGGIATPLIARWPARIKSGNRITRESGHVIDLMPTCLAVTGASYPKTFNQHELIPLEGRSLLPAFEGRKTRNRDALFWEHEGNRAVRQGKWKLVAPHRADWTLYDIAADGTELNNLAARQPEKLSELLKLYEQWAARCNVEHWEVIERSRQTVQVLPRPPLSRRPLDTRP